MFQKHFRIILLLNVLCVFCLTGCATQHPRTRFYDGAALPGNKVSVLFTVNYCHFIYIRDKIETDNKLIIFKKTLELLPGQYVVSIGYLETGMYSDTSGEQVEYELDVQPGNNYVVFPEFTEFFKNAGKWRPGKWRPVIMNIEDYSKEKCNKAGGGGLIATCPEKSTLQQWTAEYLKSERSIMTFHPIDNPNNAYKVKSSWY